MERIAERTGGRFFEVKKKDNLDEIYNQIAEELRGQYLMTYTPDKADTDGGFHKIALKASKDDLQGIMALLKQQDLDFPLDFQNYR